jgi:hypothetical protein
VVTTCDHAWKTGAKVRIPVTKCLKAMLDNTPRTATVILTNSRGRGSFLSGRAHVQHINGSIRHPNRSNT